MAVTSILCIFIGCYTPYLYRMLPYPVEFEPYTAYQKYRKRPPARRPFSFREAIKPFSSLSTQECLMKNRDSREEHLGLKINRYITYVLVVTSISFALVAVYYYIKAAFE